MKRLVKYYSDNVLEAQVHPNMGRFRAICYTAASIPESSMGKWNAIPNYAKYYGPIVHNFGAYVSPSIPFVPAPIIFVSNHMNSTKDAFEALVEIFQYDTTMYTCIVHLNTGQLWKCTQKGEDQTPLIRKFLDYTDMEKRSEENVKIMQEMFSSEIHSMRGRMAAKKFGF